MLFISSNLIETASNYLVLSLTPTESLSPKEQQEKTDLIGMRNRVLRALTKECQKITDESQKNLLLTAIKTVKEFFLKIGGSAEETIAELSFLSPSKLIEGSIADSIISSTKSDDACSKKELSEKESNKTLRDQMIATALHKAPGPIKHRIIECVTMLGGEIPMNSFG